MNNQQLATWDVLTDLGFQPDPGVFSDVRPGLSFDFGSFKLSASRVVNMRFVDVVLITGIVATGRFLAEVSFEMPLSVVSREQCAAWIAWHLERAASRGGNHLSGETAWILEGRQNFMLLPWVAKQVAYQARPRCLVRREWLRVALKTLQEVLATLEDEADVSISFDGEALKIWRDGKGVILPAEGQPWKNRFTIPAERLRSLPKRIMDEIVEVSVWEETLNVGRNRFAGIRVDG